MSRSRQKKRRVKKMLWQSIRIFKREGFAVPDLLRTTPGATFDSVNRWILDLERHGIVIRLNYPLAENQHQRFRIAPERDTVLYPVICAKCNLYLHQKCVISAYNYRRARKRRISPARAGDGKGRVADMVERVQRMFGLPLPQQQVQQPPRRSKVPENIKRRLERRLNGEIDGSAKEGPAG